MIKNLKIKIFFFWKTYGTGEFALEFFREFELAFGEYINGVSNEFSLEIVPWIDCRDVSIVDPFVWLFKVGVPKLHKSCSEPF